MTDHHTTLELVKHDGRSTLELVRHDEAAQAPERDYDATAFELDASCLAPEVSGEYKWQEIGPDHGSTQVLPGTAPQVLYRASLPEVNSSTEKSSEVAVVRDAPKPTLKWLWLLVALVLVAAVGIGVGVGVWHTRQGSSGIRYYLLRYTHTHSLTLPVNQAPVRRLPTRQQNVHLPMHPLHSTSSMIHHWPR